MKSCVSLLFITVVCLTGCNNDDTTEYPKLYTYTHVEQEDGQTFIITTTGDADPIVTPGGAYGEFIDSLDQFIVNSLMQFFFIEEFELLSESSIRFRGLFDQVLVDTTVTYTMQDEQLVIENIDPEFIGYDRNADEFQVCAYVRIGLHGPNTPQNPQEYGIITSSCEDDFDGHLDAILTQELFVPGDTLGLYFLKMIYEKE